MFQMISEKSCLELLRKEGVPDNVIRHARAVGKVAVYLAKMVMKRGVKVDIGLVKRAALLHDICKIRYLHTEKEPFHEEEGAKLLRQRGLDLIADIVEAHGTIALLGGKVNSWEKKLMCYADARVVGDTVTSLKERFEYLEKRYPEAVGNFRKITPILKKIEKEIFGNTPTDLGFLNEEK